jgi:signal transduction histidine kinase
LAAPPAPGRAPETIDVTVCDSGSGIAEADLSRLFERHVRGRGGAPGARGEGSKGLGLAIVRRIVELHGGEVTLASHPGHGTTVTIKLPRPAHPGARADERSGPISEAGAAAPAPLRPGPRTSPS